MNNENTTDPSEIYKIELIQTRVTADEKIQALRMSQELDIPISNIIRALLKQALEAWSKGSIGGLALEQKGMDTVLKALKPSPKGPRP